MTATRIAALLMFSPLFCCSPRAKTTEDRSAVDVILLARGLPKVPTGARNLSAITTKSRTYDEYEIHFVCAPIECAQFISQVAGAPAHDNGPSVEEIVRYLESGPSYQVLRDRDITEEPHHTYIMAKRQSDGTFSVTIELADIH